jgi:pimeloyl-ACP methyl ester carboxylesterase
MVTERSVRIPIESSATVIGDLRLPDGANGLVIFAHGSGSSRRSPRNREVAEALNVAGLATLLIDLLVEDEDVDHGDARHPKWDIEMLSKRLAQTREWTADDPELASLPVGYFGASTGAAAALAATARERDLIHAVVSRGGRPDLAGDQLRSVQAPTLLIVGGRDTEVLELNRQAASKMRAEVELVIVPEATHLFPEPGAMAQVAALAVKWFTTHLPINRTSGGRS